MKHIYMVVYVMVSEGAASPFRAVRLYRAIDRLQALATDTISEDLQDY